MPNIYLDKHESPIQTVPLVELHFPFWKSSHEEHSNAGKPVSEEMDSAKYNAALSCEQANAEE